MVGELALSNGVLTVSLDGRAVYTKTPSAGMVGKRFYFKIGDLTRSRRRARR
jgi:hypothetical protein